MILLSDKFSTPPEALQVSQCILCARKPAGIGVAVCQAFPGGIPDAILRNRFDHRRPYPDAQNPDDVGVRGDRSLLFYPVSSAPPARLRELYRILDAAPQQVEVPDRIPDVVPAKDPVGITADYLGFLIPDEP